MSSAKVLRHLQFTKRIPFEQGLAIQEQFVRANLDMKKLQSKIEHKLIELDDKYRGTATVNSKEKEILDRIMEMKPNPMVLTFEFEPTYTGGKRIKKTITPEQISEFGNFEPTNQSDNPKPKFVQTERGGEITFHGPGQMVAYIIMDLKAFRDFPARCLISAIETATKNTLKHSPVGESRSTLKIETKRVGDKTGVWALNDEKIASIGIHVRRSITSHGVCINVCPDLSYLNNFEMCGTPDGKATSILQETTKSNVTVQEISIAFVRQLAKLLGIYTVERMQTDGSEIK
ncbi:Lipoyl ligase [Maudiozyma exigua]|uniref:Octanoyltransferase n=1 Tax=Maudiozyma exigua TaxID=34358 RepID=A0A9P7B8W1_MAUEX|nr:Lipoyl ligase [Kazachstania exigua]